jgi:hypothetical protein
MTVEMQLTSETVSDGLESSSITRTYNVLDTAGGAVSYSSALSALTALNTTEVVGGNTLKVVSRSLEREKEALQKLWRATVNYEWSFNKGDGTAANTFVSLDLSTTTQFVDVWRVGANFPTSISNPADTDIGGTAVDQCGEPVSTLLNQQEMTVTNIRSDNNASAILSCIGKRNSVSFLGASQDYVLFVGATSRRTESAKYEVQYKFLWDQAKHLRQVCARDVDGQPLLGSPNGAGAVKASLVYARQPFPNTIDFASTLGLVTS